MAPPARLACRTCGWQGQPYSALKPPPRALADARQHEHEAHGPPQRLLKVGRPILGILAIALAVVVSADLSSDLAVTLLSALLILAVLRVSQWDAAAIAALCAATLLIIPARYSLGPFAATPAVLVGVFALALWVAGKLIGRAFSWGRHPIGTSIFLFVGTVFIGYAAGHLRVLTSFEAKAADRKMLLLLAVVGVALMLADGVKSIARVRLVVGMIVAGGAIMASVGIVQFTTGNDIAAELKPPGFTADTQNLDFIAQRDGYRRVSGTAMHAIEFGVASAMILPLAIHLAMTAQAFWARRLAVIAALLLALAIPMSISRSAFLAVGVVALTMLPFWPGRVKWRVIAGAVAAVVVLTFASPGLMADVASRFTNTSSDSSVQGRTIDYGPIFDFVAKSPWTGRGYGTFDAQQYFHVDNQYLVTLVETGIIGTAGMLVLLFTGPMVARRIRQATRDPAVADLSRSLGCVVMIAIVSCATFDLFGFRIVTGLLFISLGLLGAMYRIVHQGLGEPSPAGTSAGLGHGAPHAVLERG